MAMKCMNRSFHRTFAAVGGKAKKGSKGGDAGDAPKASILTKEVKSTTVIGAKVMLDSECPDWLWHMLDKCPALSALKRKNVENMPYCGILNALLNWTTVLE